MVPWSTLKSKKVIRKAVLTLQHHRTQKLVIDARNKGMASTVVKNLPYRELCEKLQGSELMKVSKLIFHRVCVLTEKGVSLCPEAGEYKVHNVRTFLASYMIAWYPEKVFRNQGDLELKLRKTAVEMLKIFDTFCDEITRCDNWVDTKEAVDRAILFRCRLHEYESVMEHWRTLDQNYVVASITNALNALQDSDDNLIESEADFHYYRANFRSEKKRLLKLLRERLSADKIQMIQDERACKGQSMYTTVVEVSGEINLRSILMG
jgi:hypothetical protein